MCLIWGCQVKAFLGSSCGMNGMHHHWSPCKTYLCGTMRCVAMRIITAITVLTKGVVSWYDNSHDAVMKGLAHTYKSPYRIAARRLLHGAHLNPIELFCPSF